jgi:3-deoxy-D-manno-octulosonate 8-phosphate phosphatase (KDO 8-P phosphatase)
MAVTKKIKSLASKVRLLLLDVDGVLTDGTLSYLPLGEQEKRFFVRDGLAIRLLLSAGVNVAVLSGRLGDATVTRCRELGIREDLIVQGSRDKAADLDRLSNRLDLEDSQIAAMGDDLPDLPVLYRVGFAACPADAAPEVAAACHLVCGSLGGRGAVREVAELILKAQARWMEMVSKWTSRRSGPSRQPDQDS